MAGGPANPHQLGYPGHGARATQQPQKLSDYNSRLLAYIRYQMTGGDSDHDAALIARDGCASCHTVPGVRGAEGKVGLPLPDFARRVYVAGKFPNNVSNLVNWIRTPQKMDPGTAVPDMGVTEQDAQDIAAYLYTSIHRCGF